MKIILVMVTTISGKITRGDNPDITPWTSQEDKAFFGEMLKTHNLIVMGSTTYEAAKESMKLDGTKRRIVLTRDPEKYKKDVVPGQLEFTNEHEGKLVSRLEREGYSELLLLGGGETNRRFFEQGLVDELYMTLEPLLFGRGRPIVTEGEYDVELELIDHKRLNTKGTLLFHYNVLHVQK